MELWETWENGEAGAGDLCCDKSKLIMYVELAHFVINIRKKFPQFVQPTRERRDE